MQPDEPNQEERLEQLPQDGQTPFQPADPNPSVTGSSDPITQDITSADLPTDHPATDADLDSHELYDEGVSGATEVEDNSGQTAVTDFNPDLETIDDETL